jgi:hypothetical protein
MMKILPIVKTFLDEKKFPLVKSYKKKGGSLLETALLISGSVSQELICYH